MAKNELDLEAEQFLDRVSANVVKARKAKGFSQLQLATEMGYKSASYLGRIEIRSEGQHFHLVQLYKIAKILNISVEELVH
ncbi:helix-turn-helix transcriptional regulator [Sulfuricurvum sp.]|uniref:helix-turn-helix domain-containing protein n=1 Tax=Sulfuricurvum sp. TaxID=2025608 RepID=UPI00263047DC|nr:helix-turn-helix transcriptional regulator [Sulfuricurvum sp.]MDD2781949.1 helix-turn-helix transcriptional regulator [Sulfuricurvum sp.]